MVRLPFVLSLQRGSRNVEVHSLVQVTKKIVCVCVCMCVFFSCAPRSGRTFSWCGASVGGRKVPVEAKTTDDSNIQTRRRRRQADAEAGAKAETEVDAESEAEAAGRAGPRPLQRANEPQDEAKLRPFHAD